MCGATGLWVAGLAFGLWLKSRAIIHLVACPRRTFLDHHLDVLVPASPIDAALFGFTAGARAPRLSAGPNTISQS